MKNKRVLGQAMTLMFSAALGAPAFADGNAPPASSEPRPAPAQPLAPAEPPAFVDKVVPKVPDADSATVRPMDAQTSAASTTVGPTTPPDLSQDEFASVMQAKPASRAIFQAGMTLPPADVAAAIKSRYEAYAKANLTAKTFDDLDSFVSKDLRDRSQKIKQLIYESPKTRDKPEKEKEEAYAGMFQFINMMKPRYATVTGIKASGDVAIISVTSHDVGALPEALIQGMTGMMTGMVNGMAQGMASAVPGGKKPAPVKAPLMKMPNLAGKIYMQKEEGRWNFAGEDYEQVFTAEEKKQQAAAKAQAGWCAQAATMPLSQKPVTGMLHGAKFVMRNAEYRGGILTLRSGTQFFPDLAVTIFIFGMDNARPDGQTIIMQNGDKKDGKDCHVSMEWHKPGVKFNESKTYMSMDKLGLKLQFGQRKDGKLPGFINLRLPDAAHSNLQGYFWADLK